MNNIEYYAYIIEHNPNPIIYCNFKKGDKNKIKNCMEFLKNKKIDFTIQRIWSQNSINPARLLKLSITNKIYCDFWSKDCDIKRPSLSTYHNLFKE